MTARIVPDYHELARLLERERAAGSSVALANGCFDVIHVGHVRLLADARRQADLLVVALNSDASVRAIKEPGRPHLPLAERMEIVAAFEGVDYVTSFEELTAGPLIETLRPEVQVKGTDRSPESVPEREILERFGGRIVICGDRKTHSSTELVARLREGSNDGERGGRTRAYASYTAGNFPIQGGNSVAGSTQQQRQPTESQRKILALDATTNSTRSREENSITGSSVAQFRVPRAKPLG